MFCIGKSGKIVFVKFIVDVVKVLLYNNKQIINTVILQRWEESVALSSEQYSQNLVVKYRIAWDYYLKNCQNHGIDCKITFGQFVNFLTTEQMEKLLSQVGAWWIGKWCACKDSTK